MTVAEYVELKRLHSKILAGIADPNLSQALRKKLDKTSEVITAKRAGLWIPVGWPRRMIMAMLVGVGILSLTLYPHYNWLLVAWLCAVCMSTRLVGEAAYLVTTRHEWLPSWPTLWRLITRARKA